VKIALFTGFRGPNWVGPSSQLGWDLLPNPIDGFPVGGTTRWEPKTQPTPYYTNKIFSSYFCPSYSKWGLDFPYYS
jgi:hypothetical protein